MNEYEDEESPMEVTLPTTLSLTSAATVLPRRGGLSHVERNIIRMRSQGQSFEQICTWLEATKGKKVTTLRAQEIWVKALTKAREQIAEPELMRAQYLDTYEMLQEALIPDALGDEDNSPDLRAIDRLLAVMDKKTKLLGLQEAQRVEVKNTSDSSDWLSTMSLRLRESQESRQALRGHIIDVAPVAAFPQEDVQLPEHWYDDNNPESD